MKPSRTFFTFLTTAVLELLLGVLVVVVAIVAPEQLDQVVKAITAIASVLGLAGGAGAIALGIRDGMSGGLTSSQGAEVAEAKVRIAQAQPAAVVVSQGA